MRSNYFVTYNLCGIYLIRLPGSEFHEFYNKCYLSHIRILGLVVKNKVKAQIDLLKG
jgi:hypothetical protein